MNPRSCPRASVAVCLLLAGIVSCGRDPATFSVVTFNVGTSSGVIDGDENGGYGPQQAEMSDLYYGNGLAWLAAVEAVRAYVDAHVPDVVAFQEIFDVTECASVPEEAREGFACDGDPTPVPRRVLGPDYQFACHPGKTDKCLAVHARFGRFEGCDEDRCDAALDGFPVAGCGSGARVARAVVERPDGSRLTLVSVHGTSGVSESDVDCRVAQIEQVFVDLGDGEPGVSGSANVVLGDFNTDPHRLSEPSALLWIDHTSGESAFRFVSPMGPDAPRAYAGLFDIDHVVSDAFRGHCHIAGVTEGEPQVSAMDYFDHRPVRCILERAP
jgi:hypothetical protein